MLCQLQGSGLVIGDILFTVDKELVHTAALSHFCEAFWFYPL